MTREQARRHHLNLARLDRQLAMVADPERSTRDRRRAARYAAALAEKLGMIERPGRCEWCNYRRILERHHPRYDMPLHVIYLCTQCHILADQMDGTVGRDGPIAEAG